MIIKSSSIRIRMTSMGLWSLEGTPGILEVFTNVKHSALEDQDGDAGSNSPIYKRAEVATKLLETLENFNYDDTEEERSDAYFSGWLDSDEKVIDLPIFEDFQTSSPASNPPPPPPLVPITHSNNAATGFNQGQAHVKVGYESSPLWNADYPTSLYSPPAVPHITSSGSSGAWSPHTMDQLAGVSCTLTPPTSPHMYSPKRCEEIQKYDAFLNMEPVLAPVAAAVAGEKESGQLILSLLAEMNQSEIDEIMKNQFGGGGAAGGGNEDANGSVSNDATDFNMVEEGTYGTNGLNSGNGLIYGGEISPMDSSCSSSIDGFSTEGKSLLVTSYEETSGVSSPIGISSPFGAANDNSCHSFSEASSSSGGDYASESSEMSDPDYSPYSPVPVAGDKGGRKSTQKFVTRNGVGAQASTGAVRKEPTAKRSRGAAAKPYARKSVAPEDKKLRKKEQNKNAATRYRIKKKQEVEVILGEEKGLEDKNVDLVKQVEDLQREISFMKKFMRDFFKTQGRLK